MRKFTKAICTVLSVLMLLTSVVQFAYAESFKAIVTASSMRVYRDEKLKNYWGKLSKDKVVMVESYSGGIAKVTYAGKTGYAAADDMAALSAISRTAITTVATRAYKKASTKSSYSRVGKGITVNVISVTGKCAKVERNGAIAYMYTEHLSINGEEKPAEPVVDDKEEVPSKTADTLEDIFNSGKYTNDVLTYMFCVKVMGLNSAAACGIMANIKYESGYKPTTGGDSGSSYGICQWHAGRKNRLNSWCESNGYAHDTLLGQLYYLQYEMQKYYPAVWKYLNGVDDTPEGAYDAAYYFCYNFEAPANKASKSTTRGNYAQQTLYPKFSKM